MLQLVLLCIVSFLTQYASAIPYDAKGPEYPVSSPISLGASGISESLKDWYTVTFPSEKGPYLETDTSKLAVGQFKSVSKLIKDKVHFKNITFFNLADVAVDRQASQKFESADGSLSPERHYGSFGVNHDSYNATIVLTSAKDGKTYTCPGLGFAKMVYVQKDGSTVVDNSQYINYDVVSISKPFKYVGLSDWSVDPSRRQVEYFLFINPKCGNFEDGEIDLSKITSAIDKVLGTARTRALTGVAMKKHFEKWVIEPNRMLLVGKTRLPNSETDLEDVDLAPFLPQESV